jgi:hypothetical protein
LDDPTTRVALRLPSALVARLDQHAERMRQEQPGVAVSRTDVVRLLLTSAIAEVEPAGVQKKSRSSRPRRARSEA